MPPPRARLSRRPPARKPLCLPTLRPPEARLTAPPAFFLATAPPSFLSLASEATLDEPPEYQVPPPILRLAALPAMRILPLCSLGLQRLQSHTTDVAKDRRVEPHPANIRQVSIDQSRSDIRRQHRSRRTQSTPCH